MSQMLGLGEKFPEFSLHACVSAEDGEEFVFTGLIMGFWLKKKALEVRALKARGSEEMDGPREDLNDTRAQSWPR